LPASRMSAATSMGRDLMSRLRAVLTVLASAFVFTALMLLAMRYRDRNRGPISFTEWPSPAAPAPR
jgi:hypothetical protein